MAKPSRSNAASHQSEAYSRTSSRISPSAVETLNKANLYALSICFRTRKDRKARAPNAKNLGDAESRRKISLPPWNFAGPVSGRHGVSWLRVQKQLGGAKHCDRPLKLHRGSQPPARVNRQSVHKTATFRFTVAGQEAKPMAPSAEFHPRP